MEISNPFYLEFNETIYGIWKSNQLLFIIFQCNEGLIYMQEEILSQGKIKNS
jgi:hypothetical protein